MDRIVKSIDQDRRMCPFGILLTLPIPIENIHVGNYCQIVFPSLVFYCPIPFP